MKTIRDSGGMDVDFRVRCAVDNGDFVRIYYGHTAAEYEGPGSLTVYDLTDNFKDLSTGGRRPGKWRDEDGRQKFFFTKSLKRDVGLQGSGNVGVVGALYGEGGAGGAQEVAAQAGSAGGGYRRTDDRTTGKSEHFAAPYGAENKEGEV